MTNTKNLSDLCGECFFFQFGNVLEGFHYAFCYFVPCRGFSIYGGLSSPIKTVQVLPAIGSPVIPGPDLYQNQTDSNGCACQVNWKLTFMKSRSGVANLFCSRAIIWNKKLGGPKNKTNRPFSLIKFQIFTLNHKCKV
jgi:hypothetical protein